MKRKLLIVVGLIIGAAGALALGRQQIGTTISRVTGQPEPPPDKQWPFDGHELRTLMDRTIASQRAIVANAENPAVRARAEAFQSYYEGRRAAAVGES